jgi:hypothetical protein
MSTIGLDLASDLRGLQRPARCSRSQSNLGTGWQLTLSNSGQLSGAAWQSAAEFRTLLE